MSIADSTYRYSEADFFLVPRTEGSTRDVIACHIMRQVSVRASDDWLVVYVSPRHQTAMVDEFAVLSPPDNRTTLTAIRTWPMPVEILVFKGVGAIEQIERGYFDAREFELIDLGHLYPTQAKAEAARR